MNLEDFKSFRRALIPSEVGSIPTHSRQHRDRRPRGVGATGALALALALLLGTAPGARGQEAPETGEPTDPFAEGPTAFQRAARSALVPAWGQITNGKSRKATVLFVVQTYLYTRIVQETRQAHEDKRLRDSLERAGAAEAEVVLAESWAQGHFDARRNLFFWAILAGFYGAIDAYIDAHLGDFDEELEDGRALFADVDPMERSVALGLRF